MHCIRSRDAPVARMRFTCPFPVNLPVAPAPEDRYTPTTIHVTGR